PYATPARPTGSARLPYFQNDIKPYGIYNFSNEGVCSWYDFAKKIFEVNQIDILLNPIPTTAYPTPAKRPKYSVLDKKKIKETFALSINPWDKTLQTVKR
ncbi:MAG: hypothetical protein E2604_09620, partial [Flavobacterium sp.]|nr:hypothetical protein [Flavobacterium sp.]